MTVYVQIVWLLILATPVACISWTVTHEEIFREPREYCAKRSTNSNTFIERKLFYPFTCEYCFSHYITILVLVFTDFKMLTNGWFGYVIALFSLVWISNIYMSLFAYIRQNIAVEKAEISIMKEKESTDIKLENKITHEK